MDVSLEHIPCLGYPSLHTPSGSPEFRRTKGGEAGKREGRGEEQGEAPGAPGARPGCRPEGRDRGREGARGAGPPAETCLRGGGGGGWRLKGRRFGEGRARGRERGRDGAAAGRWGRRAGGRLQLPPATPGLQAAGRTQRRAIHRGAARGRPSPEPRAPSPERAPRPPRPPRASLSLDALLPPPPPGRQRAPSKLRARLSARGKVSPAAADASWHGVRPLRLEGRGPAPPCPPRAPPPRPPGDLGTHARPPTPTPAWWGWRVEWGGPPRMVLGKPGNRVLLRL